MHREQDAVVTTISFNPSLWEQRRIFANKILHALKAKTVFDIGCGEGALLEILKNSIQFDKLIGMDLSDESLKLCINLCQPSEYNKRYPRERSITLEIYKGSIMNYDPRCNAEVICCLEVIEHLDKEVLDAFPKTVLGQYAPNVFIVSTPNAEFNVHFPNLKYGTPEQTFRNDDHRFEWTRKEFQDWCYENARKYGYSVFFGGRGLERVEDGIATTSDGYERQRYKLDYNPSIGHCTQLAVFFKNDFLENARDLGSDVVVKNGNNKRVREGDDEEGRGKSGGKEEKAGEYELKSVIDNYPVVEGMQGSSEQELIRFLHRLTPEVYRYADIPLIWADSKSSSSSSSKSSKLTVDQFWDLAEIREKFQTTDNLLQVMKRAPKLFRVTTTPPPTYKRVSVEQLTNAFVKVVEKNELVGPGHVLWIDPYSEPMNEILEGSAVFPKESVVLIEVMRQ